MMASVQPSACESLCRPGPAPPAARQPVPVSVRRRPLPTVQAPAISCRPMAPRPALSSRQGTEYYDTLLIVRTADEPAASSASAVGEKRKRSQEDGEEEEAQAEQARAQQEGEQMLASGFVLTQCSPYFRAALGEQWGGDRKRVEVTVDSIPAFQHLLEFMHSMGKALPEGALPASQPACQAAKQPGIVCMTPTRASVCGMGSCGRPHSSTCVRLIVCRCH